jgi:hypothetical protein
MPDQMTYNPLNVGRILLSPPFVSASELGHPLNADTWEPVEKTLEQDGNEVRDFYPTLPAKT